MTGSLSLFLIFFLDLFSDFAGLTVAGAAAGRLVPVSSRDKDLRCPCAGAFSDLKVRVAERALAASCALHEDTEDIF